MQRVLPQPLDARAESEPLDLTREYERHADFVWRSLQHFGVRAGELEDALQEVFLIAHRKAGEYDPRRARITTWLFGIAMRVTQGLKRRRLTLAETEELVERDTPEAVSIRRRGMRALSEALDALSPEHRATFVLFELEGESCATIAELFAVPIGTVYSRLHTARAAVRATLLERGVIP